MACLMLFLVDIKIRFCTDVTSMEIVASFHTFNHSLLNTILIGQCTNENLKALLEFSHGYLLKPTTFKSVIWNGFMSLYSMGALLSQ